MILQIDTSKNNLFKIGVLNKGDVIDALVFETDRNQAEKLLPEIDNMLRKNNINLDQIEKIQVEAGGEGFTALRIGILTANTLGYALGIPVEPMSGKECKSKGESGKFDVVEPEYNREPNIT